jgi:Ca-activated chloride channel family protein
MFGSASSALAAQGETGQAVAAAAETPAAAAAELPAKYRAWLEEVAILISPEERQAFLTLTQDYQREAFIDRFWRQRDPYPDTGRNELRERWEERVKLARSRFGRLDDVRAAVLLLNGAPTLWKRIACRAALWPLEIWFYAAGSERYRAPFVLVLYQRLGGYAVWQPSYGFEELTSFDRTAACSPQDSEILQAAIRWIREQGDFGYLAICERATTAPALGGREWVATFSAYSTDLPAGAATFPARLTLDFPGWYQNRTVVQGALAVPVAAVGMAEFGGHRSFNFVLTGEVLEGEALFDSFRYKFDFPADAAPAGGELPLVFQRYLRPGGPYNLIVKLEDLASGHLHRSERMIEVPRVTTQEIPPPADPRLAQVLAEANAALAAGETTIKVVPPMGDLLAGLVRFDTLVTGGGIRQVTFSLNGESILSKTRPPFSVELDLGDFPRTHLLRATAHGASGEELASDELLVNLADSRFRVHLVEPQRGKLYERSLRARAEVEVPKGEAVERLEFYLNETRVATLYQPPYVQPIVLPPEEPLLYVRAVAWRPDGGFAEDVVFVNAPDYAEDLSIQLVELYTSVLDRAGRPVGGIAREAFEVFEDGVAQDIVRFEPVEDLPIHAAILLDVSASMAERLEAARGAALSFFEQAIRPRDRAALITFNDRPYLAAAFTNELSTFAGGLAGLKAERGTALFDSLIYSLFYFTGISGQRALVVLSDGKDEGSRFGFDEALDYARRAGITVYAVSLGLGKQDGAAKRNLARLADETGGRAFFLDSIDGLTGAYAEIERELRSQYLIAYQSKNTARSAAFRTVDLKVDRRGVEVKTLRGYYP